MFEETSSVPQYPTVRFLARWGRCFTAIMTLAPVLAGLVVLFYGGSWLWLGAALLVTPVVYLVISSYMELIRIIGDTLLPR